MHLERVLALLIFALLPLMSCSQAKLLNRKNASTPAVRAVIPNSIAFNQSAQVVVIGSGFVNGATPKVGGEPCRDPEVISDTTLLCTTVPAAIGNAEVSVTNPNGLTGRLLNGVTFVSAVNPVAGYAITSGGGKASGTSRVANASVGEHGTQGVQSGSHRVMVGGIKAIDSD